jgi:ribonuclease D
VKKYLEIRARASVESSDLTRKNKGAAYNPEGIVTHPELYRALKMWRNEKADDLNVENYFILPQKVLMELISLLPGSTAELKKIKGLGPKKVGQFGKEILTIIADYRIKSKTEIPDPVKEVVTKDVKFKIPKPDTKFVTLELFKSGKSISEISEIRGIVVATIEAHLLQFVESGEIGIDRLVGPVKTAVITHWFLRNGSLGLAAAKAELGSDVSYGELRFVRKYLEYSKQISL